MAYINKKFIKEKPIDEDEQRRTEFAAHLLGMKKQGPETSPYRRRYENIRQGGLEATAYETKKRNDREKAYLDSIRKKIQEANARVVRVSTGDPGTDYFNLPNGIDGKGIPSVKGNSTFEKFVNAITGQESGGNYSARNKSSGAMGRYQIMPSNLGGRKSGWDYEALGYDVTHQQFMSNPKIQDAIARYKLQQYYNKYGAWGAAVAWYAGPGAVSRANKDKSQGAYPTIRQYANSILKRMGL
jgi:hypothetical protein